MKILRFLLVLLIVVILGGALFAFFFALENTSLFTGPVPEEQLEENNFNSEVNDVNQNVTTLVEKRLVVPEQYTAEPFDVDHTLNLPEGFEISVYAAGMDAPRFIDFHQSGALIVADKNADTISMLPDVDEDGVADEILTIDSDLRSPHSVHLHNGDLFSGEEDKVVVYRNLKPDGTYDSKEVIVDNLPHTDVIRLGHYTRTVLIGPDEKLYVSIGSTCNVCEEEDKRRAAIVRYNLDGSGEEIFAEGLRNSVGIEFLGDELWAVNNGRDRLGDDVPAEEINIVEQGKHYGWPYCHEDGIASPEFPDRTEFCQNETVDPVYKMQAHSAPLGMTFFPDNARSIYPTELRNDLFIGFHGSWNRTVPTGYKIVRLDTDDKGSETINFITGWLEDDGSSWGRPVDVQFGPSGDMFISDDKAGAIYRATYTE